MQYFATPASISFKCTWVTNQPSNHLSACFLICARPTRIFHVHNTKCSWYTNLTQCSDTGRRKILWVPVVIGGDNLPSPVAIGLTDLPNIGWASGPPAPPRFRHHYRSSTPTNQHHIEQPTSYVYVQCTSVQCIFFGTFYKIARMNELSILSQGINQILTAKRILERSEIQTSSPFLKIW